MSIRLSCHVQMTMSIHRMLQFSLNLLSSPIPLKLRNNGRLDCFVALYYIYLQASTMSERIAGTTPTNKYIYILQSSDNMLTP